MVKRFRKASGSRQSEHRTTAQHAPAGGRNRSCSGSAQKGAQGPHPAPPAYFGTTHPHHTCPVRRPGWHQGMCIVAIVFQLFRVSACSRARARGDREGVFSTCRSALCRSRSPLRDHLVAHHHHERSHDQDRHERAPHARVRLLQGGVDRVPEHDEHEPQYPEQEYRER